MLAVAVVLAILAQVSLAQRPSSASTCDYYAAVRYGANSSATQFQLVQSIVSLAFAGKFNLSDGSPSNVSSDITGILNLGVFQNLIVDLRPWFNGSLASTNLNNQPVGINWLDDGGLDPLYKYLNGQTQSVVLTNTTNQHRLFGNFYVAFSHIFGCSNPPPPLPSAGAPLNLAYVHKYMGLNFTDLGYFIDQLTRATEYYGFSEQDGQTFNTRMNSLYNVRCAPPITLSPAQGPQLLSLCQAASCPLAVPDSDCAPYVNLTANGSPAASSGASVPSSTGASSSSTSASGPTSATSSAQTSAAATDSSTSTLSAGAIAGIAIGGAAVLILLVVAIILLRRRRQPPQQQQQQQQQPQTNGPTPVEPYSPHKEYHNSYMSNVPTIAEMDSPRVVSSLSSPEPYSPDTGNRVASQDMYSQPPVEIGGYE